MRREDYIYDLQEEAFESLEKEDVFKIAIPAFEKMYVDIDYKLRQPDLLGKTVKATTNQFSEVYCMVEDLADEAGIEVPAVYIYEDFYYGMESYGVEEFWIEISAKTIKDLNKKELCFLLAREIYKIADGITRMNTLMNMQAEILYDRKAYKLAFYKWYRLANYTADNYGYLACRSIKDAINAILKLVLNSVSLAQEVDIEEFIGQAAEISRLNGKVYNHTKLDEPIPYAPYRVKNLLAYAMSDRAMKYYERKR